MQAYLPFNESLRLKALQGLEILDTPSDPRFEKLTRSVAEALDVPIVTISFVDEDRVWNKSAVGLPLPKFRDTPRLMSFSAHTILTPGVPLVVEDASKDARFAGSPVVVGPPFVRFYAGCAIADEQGLPIGTLSAVDHTPRSLSEKEVRDLLLFAAQAELLIVLHASLQKLGAVAKHDALTGLGNRRLFNDKLEEHTSKGACALLHLDIDGFKAINDDYGHIAGDAALCEAARRLAVAARPGDVVTRLGGDEFAIVMPGPFEADAPDLLAARITQSMEAPFFHSGTRISLGASIGIALCPEDAATPTSLIREADLALNAVKQGGRQKHGRPQRTGAASAAPRSMEWDLLKAAENGEFELHWQPIVDLRSASLHGYEAFLRWNRPGMGEVAPDRFLPVAVRSGLITNIDRWALREACRQAAAWRDPTRFAVNVSAEWLGRRQLPETIGELLLETGVEPSRLEVDITEGLLNRDADQAARDIKTLKDMGVRIALDDFGIGFSSLSYLKDFPFDMMKLHGTFTRELRQNPRAAAVVDAAITLGHALGITVAAEGVEELWHLEFLQRHGCDLAQGYLFGRPASEPQAPGLIGRSPALLRTPHPEQNAA